MEHQKRNINLGLINELFIFNVGFVEKISTFLNEIMLENWNSMVNAKSELRYSRSLNNLKNNIKKIEENKNKVNYEEVINKNISIVKEYDLDKKYRIFLKRKIRTLDNICDLLLFLTFEYDKYRERIETKKESISKHNIKYVKDKDGYIYANMFYSGNLLVFDKLSFANEKWLFYDAIKRGVSLDLDVPEEIGVKLSPLEKKRRIYLYAINDLYRNINSILEMEHDIYFPIESYFNFASLLVSYMYKEIFEYGVKNSNLSIIWQETIKNYGSYKGLNYYEKIYWNLMDNVKSISKHVLSGYIVVSNDLKKLKDNILFKDISGFVPSLEEIYKAFNTMVITNIDNNYRYYVVDLDNRVPNSLKYMDVSEMVSFYNCFKDVLKKKSANSKLYLSLQKIVAKEIKSRNKREINYIIKEYFKEEPLN